MAADLAQLYRFLSPARRRQFFSVLALMVLGAIAELVAIGSIVPFLSLLAGDSGGELFPWLTDLFEAVGAGDHREQLVAAALLFMAAALVAGALRLQLAWSTESFVLGLGHELSVEIQRRTLAQPYSYHVSRNSSEIIASLEKVRMLTFGVLLRLMRAVTAGFIALFIIAALVRIDPFTAAIAAVAFGVLYALVSAFTRQRLARNSAILGSAFERRVQIIQESLGGVRDVIIDDSQSVYVDEFRKVDWRLTRAQVTTSFIGSAPRFVIEAAGMVLIAALALAIAGREGGLAQALPILGAVALGAQRLLPLIQQLYAAWTGLAGQRSVTAQVLDLLALPVEDQAQRSRPGEPLEFRQAIAFDKVSFTYPGRQHPAIEDVSLSIECGSRVALVGPTGSGKSTLADLLMGLLEPTEGTIAIDGTPLTRETRRAWQRSLAHVPQAIFLADASIARNIAFGVPAADIDMQRVARSAAAAQLGGFIDSLPDRYETSVGERGVRLSGGQRQRLGIARAIYKDARVLVLDEATIALDHDTEVAVLRALDQLGGEGRTVVVIAHRRSTVEHCDLIARLENGRLVELGTFAEVFGRPPRTATN
ncbi:ABC transporter ATP-binding protein [Sphingomonas sp.]|uniref:ABC transporter ATP-binding protein n=1 Tax=Sphingomonas sp. TaxID=28214 RepID=UPI0018596EDC|nr:ABC transporter ATP-binding protein [Sphingomonas sp.]MBA3512070.1 ABC transporter ATP-binding protein [Sphingomonas sp.]